MSRLIGPYSVTIISVIRLQSFIHFSHSVNVTCKCIPATSPPATLVISCADISWPGDYRQGGTWSLIELYVSIICACLPSLRVLIITIGTKFFGWESTQTGVQGSKSALSSNLSSSRTAPHNKPIKAQDTPINGDEGDFVKLVEVTTGKDGYFNGKEDKVVTKTVTKVTASDSDSQDGHPQHNYRGQW
jgi:hypothetical protein